MALANGNHGASFTYEDENKAIFPTVTARWRAWLQKKRADEHLRKLIAEMLASFLLMLYVCGSTMDNLVTDAHMNYLLFGIGAGSSIVTIILGFGHISGAHANPAVSIAFASVGKFPWAEVPGYIAVQILGGILGCLVGRSFYSVHLGIALTVPQVGILKAFWMEMIIAMVFMFLACAVSSTAAQVTGIHAALAVASAVVVNIILAGPISGGSMNPMRSLAPAIVVGKFHHVWIYVFAPPLGAVCGAWIHKLLVKQPTLED